MTSSDKYKDLSVRIIGGQSNNIYNDITLAVDKRRGFAFNNTSMVAPIYFYAILGMDNEQDYYQRLKELDHKLKQLGEIYLRLSTGLDKNFDMQKVSIFNNEWNRLRSLNSINSRNLAKFIVDQVLQRKIKPGNKLLVETALANIIESFIEKHKNTDILKNFCIKTTRWLNKYILDMLDKYEKGNINPKVLFYGDIERDEAYFLFFIYKLGFDVLYFNTQGPSKLQEVKEFGQCRILQYENREIMKEIFANQENFAAAEAEIKREETIAYKASKELSEIIHTEGTGFYKPWQFENYETKANTLVTTYEEILILWQEEARFRPSFKIEKGIVNIPNIMAKISGTQQELNKYWEDFRYLTRDKNFVVLIEKLPFLPKRMYYRDARILNKEGLLDKNYLKRAPSYKIDYLKTATQNLILSKINQTLQLTNVYKFKLDRDMRIDIINIILDLDKKYFDLIQKFDYPFKIPKLVIYDNDEKVFTQEEVVVITFLHLIGFDIVILTPSGYNNIENGINEEFIAHHKLEMKRINLEIPQNIDYIDKQPKKSVFDKIINKIIKN